MQISRGFSMGRAGIEPATHGFSGHPSAESNASQTDNLANPQFDSAALALQFTPELQEILESWPRLSTADRSAVLAKVRAILRADGGREGGL